jgi:putative redox protein
MKTASVQLDGTGLRFNARTRSGHSLVVDGAEGDAGPRPTELLLVALAGCTAMDVISILRKKRQVVEDYEVVVRGDQSPEHPAAFTEIEVMHVVRGPVDPEAVRRAVELSATRYCAVDAALSSGVARIRHEIRVERPDSVVTSEVTVSGPHRTLSGPVAA